MSSDDWCLIESDPGVFTSLLEKLGCSNVEVQELWSLDDSVLAEQQLTDNNCYGLIFLFEWKGEQQQAHAADQQPLTESEIPANLFFAHQVTTNACATQALLSVLFNAAYASDKLPQEHLGATLQEFATFTAEFPPQLKGVAISGSHEILTAHNSFAVQHSFLSEGKQYDKDKSKGEAFHFVAYVPVGDTVYELDGLQTGPMVVGKNDNNNNTSNTSNNWLSIARTAVQNRMQSLGDGGIKFNLLSVGPDQRIALRERLAVDPHDAATVAALEHEEHKRQQWQLENERRCHNFVPAVVQLLRELAAAGKLRGLVNDAKEKQQHRLQAAVQNKSAAK